MKAVIVECSNGAAVALCDDGTFRRLKNKGYSIGQELLIKRNPSSNRMVQKLSICASLALVLLSFVGIGSYSYVEPYSYVSLDINPSIEYALNRYDKVISVSGINDEGQQVVSSIEADIKNQNITTALGVTIGQLEKDNYIIQEGYNHVIVSVYSNNNIKVQSITSRVNTLSAEKSDICSIDTIPVTKEVKEDADSLGITPGKLALIQAVAETTSDSDFNVSEWTDKTVSELENTIQQANMQTTDSGVSPASSNVVDSEYLTNVLDDNAANRSDNTTASAVEADKDTNSASTDKQTSDHTTTGSSESVSASKPDNSSNTITPAANGNTGSSQKPNTSETATSEIDNMSNAQDNSSTTDQNTNVTDKGNSTNKNESDKNDTSSSKGSEITDNSSGSSSSKGDSSSSSDTKNESNDSLTEDSSSKKDSYPSPDTGTLEETSKEHIPNEENTKNGNLNEADSNHEESNTNEDSNKAISNHGISNNGIFNNHGVSNNGTTDAGTSTEVLSEGTSLNESSNITSSSKISSDKVVSND